VRRISPYISAVIAAVAVATAVASSSASAHAIWFAQRGKQLAMIYGVGADDLDAVKRMPLVTSVTGLDADGLPATATLRAAGGHPGSRQR
jgi:nickel transport protein